MMSTLDLVGLLYLHSWIVRNFRCIVLSKAGNTHRNCSVWAVEQEQWPSLPRQYVRHAPSIHPRRCNGRGQNGHQPHQKHHHTQTSKSCTMCSQRPRVRYAYYYDWRLISCPVSPRRCSQASTYQQCVVADPLHSWCDGPIPRLTGAMWNKSAVILYMCLRYVYLTILTCWLSVLIESFSSRVHSQDGLWLVCCLREAKVKSQATSTGVVTPSWSLFSLLPT